jgi:hypothetical protein
MLAASLNNQLEEILWMCLLLEEQGCGMVAQWYGDGLDGIDSRQGQDFSLLHVVQTGSGAHPASYPMGTGGSFLGIQRPGR